MTSTDSPKESHGWRGGDGEMGRWGEVEMERGGDLCVASQILEKLSFCVSP
ncbi:hypothetical protein [Calothrix sp. UHCC 0171]|uniref:hypothetical protein n=1 Tax=Calothrix sp. UHCC 0171 TaxID=3110245 RepID=UPI002B20AD06|nr:hypothetical protein [Calothrix sp. UHCC 0171]MEA5573391.1 hypothetical protein [Calothrix sp. UHCC 0171]